MGLKLDEEYNEERNKTDSTQYKVKLFSALYWMMKNRRSKTSQYQIKGETSFTRRAKVVFQ